MRKIVEARIEKLTKSIAESYAMADADEALYTRRDIEAWELDMYEAEQELRLLKNLIKEHDEKKKKKHGKS